MDRKFISLTALITLLITTVIFLLYIILSESELTVLNFYLLRNLIILYLITYILMSIKYIFEIKRQSETIKHKFFIFGQIYNIISFLVGFIFYNSIRFDIKNFFQLTFTDKILNVLFFPGSYFYGYFECSATGWSCIGSTFAITITFNTIIFTILGFILGIVIYPFGKKKK